MAHNQNRLDSDLLADALDIAAEHDKLKAVNAELLEALKQCVTSMQDSGYQNNHIAVMAARAAIAKAEGEL